MQDFVKINMTLANLSDSAKLDDEKKAKELTSRERYHAEALREIPSFLDWCHYFMLMNCSPLGGPPTEYRFFKEFINYEGDVTKMRPFSNFLPALRRYIETLLCMVTFLVLLNFVDREKLTDPAFKSEAFLYKCYTLVGAMHLKMYMMFVGFCAQEANLIATG